jgi:hypothetical protein
LQLPDFPPMSAETLEAIGERHNLHAEEISPLKDVGIFNSIYLVGSEYVLRIPRDAPPFVAAIHKVSVAVPAARAAGYFTAEEARWLSGWLDLLSPFALAPLPRRFCHGDLQTTNVMVRPDSPTYLALIDWGACGWGMLPTTSQAYRSGRSLACSRDIGRWLRSRKTRRRRPEYCGDICRSPSIFSVGHRNQDSRGPSARRRCCSRSCASSSVRLAGRGRICTEPREPRPGGATRIGQPITKYLCDFGQAY